MIQKYLNRQTPEMKAQPFAEDMPSGAGDAAVGFLAAAVLLAIIAGWLS